MKSFTDIFIRRPVLATVVSETPIRVLFPVTQRELLEAKKDASAGDPPVVRLRLADGSLYTEKGTLYMTAWLPVGLDTPEPDSTSISFVIASRSRAIVAASSGSDVPIATPIMLRKRYITTATVRPKKAPDQLTPLIIFSRTVYMTPTSSMLLKTFHGTLEGLSLIRHEEAL